MQGSLNQVTMATINVVNQTSQNNRITKRKSSHRHIINNKVKTELNLVTAAISQLAVFHLLRQLSG